MNQIAVIERLLMDFAIFGAPSSVSAVTGATRHDTWFTVANIGDEPTFDDNWNPITIQIQFTALRKTPGELKLVFDQFVSKMGRRLETILLMRAGTFNADVGRYELVMLIQATL